MTGQNGCAAPAILAVLVTVTACVGETAAGPGPSVRDSAGIRIVENPAELAARPLWTVAADPLVEIGLLEGDEVYQLSQVRSAVRLTDGRIVIANGGTQNLRFFDRTGTHLVSVGREGEGPGEFRGLGPLIVLPGDTVAAYDWNLRRMSFFGPDAAFVRSVGLDFPGGFPIPIGRFADGSWLCGRGFTFAPTGDGTEIVRDTAPMLVFEPSGTLRDSIGSFPLPELYLRSSGNAAFATSLPFGRTTEAVVHGDRFYAGHTERYELVRYSTGGAADQVLRLVRPPAPVAPGDLDRYKTEEMENVAAGFRQERARMLEEMPYPATYPAFADLMVDAAGDLWVLDYPRPGSDERRWTVFSGEGVALGTVLTPPGLRVLDIGTDYVLGVWQDELDVEYVRLFRLDRTGT
jgi:hypothetical protein